MIDILRRNKLYSQIPEDDVVSRQRFILFRIFSLTGFFVCLGVFSKMLITIEKAGILPYYILILGLVIIVNYFAVNKIVKLKQAYVLLLASSMILLHIVSYTCGGIRTGGTLYFGPVILYAYMLLGRKGGLVFAILAMVHVVYLFIVSSYTDITSFAMFKNDVQLINEDFLTNAVLSLILIALQSNYLQSAKNVIIQGLEKTQLELVKRNHELEEKNALLKDYASGLSKANKELEKFIYITSHDLKAPLRAIGSVTGMIEEDAKGSFSPEIQENFDIIKGRVNRMDQLLNAILAYSNAGRKKVKKERIALNELVNKIVEIHNREHSVTIEIKNRLPVIENDLSRIQLVFSNLIANAVRHNDKAEKVIELDCLDLDTDWSFSIRDNGPGIDPRHHEKIFVIFQTLQPRDQFETMGVGLSITRKIIEDMGGKIWVDSQPGRGAQFNFLIPKTIVESKAEMVEMMA